MASYVSFRELSSTTGYESDSDDDSHAAGSKLSADKLAQAKRSGVWTATKKDDPSTVEETAEKNRGKKKKSHSVGFKKKKQVPIEEEVEDDKERKSPSTESSKGQKYTATGRLQYRPVEDYDIKEWEPTEIPLNSFVLEYGKRRTGKSWFTRFFFYITKGKWYIATVHTGTKFNGFYQKFMDPDYIYDGYKDEALGKLFKKNKKLTMMRNEGLLPEDLHFFSLVWLDDVVSKKTLRYSEWMDTAATMGRHFDMCVGVNTQKGTKIPPTWRENADIAVIFTQIHSGTKEMLAEEYLSCLNKRTALEMIDKYTQNHGCLVLEMWRNTNVPEEFIFHFKAPEPPAFSVLAPLPADIKEALQKEEYRFTKKDKDDEI